MLRDGNEGHAWRAAAVITDLCFAQLHIVAGMGAGDRRLLVGECVKDRSPIAERIPRGMGDSTPASSGGGVSAMVRARAPGSATRPSPPQEARRAQYATLCDFGRARSMSRAAAEAFPARRAEQALNDSRAAQIMWVGQRMAPGWVPDMPQ